MAAYRCIVVAPPHTPVPGQHSYTSTPFLPNTLQPSKHLKHRGDWFPPGLAGATGGVAPASGHSTNPTIYTLNLPTANLTISIFT